MRQYHEQMLKLVAKGFYNELINYGVNEAEVLTVAGHLLDNVMHKDGTANKAVDYYLRPARDAEARRRSRNARQRHRQAGHIPVSLLCLRDPEVQKGLSALAGH